MVTTNARSNLIAISCYAFIFLILNGCSRAPVYSTSENYVPPEHPDGQACISAIRDAQTDCEREAEAKYNVCAVEAESEAIPLYQQAMFDYERQVEQARVEQQQREATLKAQRESGQLTHKLYQLEMIASAIHASGAAGRQPELADYIDLSPCRAYAEQCTREYKQSYLACGGIIDKVTRCIKHCA